MRIELPIQGHLLADGGGDDADRVQPVIPPGLQRYPCQFTYDFDLGICYADVDAPDAEVEAAMVPYKDMDLGTVLKAKPFRKDKPE